MVSSTLRLCLAGEPPDDTGTSYCTVQTVQHPISGRVSIVFGVTGLSCTVGTIHRQYITGVLVAVVPPRTGNLHHNCHETQGSQRAAEHPTVTCSRHVVTCLDNTVEVIAAGYPTPYPAWHACFSNTVQTESQHHFNILHVAAVPRLHGIPNSNEYTVSKTAGSCAQKPMQSTTSGSSQNMESSSRQSHPTHQTPKHWLQRAISFSDRTAR